MSWSAKGNFELVEPYRSGVLVTGDTKGVTVNEFNGDGVPDLAFTENSGPVTTFLNTSRGEFLCVRLKGKKGNLRAVGTRLTLRDDQGRSQTLEVSSGGSYLSQSGSFHFFGAGKQGERGQLTLEAIWPDGKSLTLNDVKPGTIEVLWD
jgi:hypothetical protein